MCREGKPFPKIEKKLPAQKEELPVQKAPSPSPVPVERGPHTKNTTETIRKLLADRGIDPVNELLDLYIETDKHGDRVMPVKERLALMKELLQYTAPKLKSVDQNINLRADLNVKLVQFTPEMIEPLKKVN